ncbi:FusB/FusC family EF-G-binding protein [Paenibacillus sp. ACRRX]|uniref:FusB/FusC family EF-G-binding protein n=1 Tax=Paenibacillus sp. ACRRX TaxID=2918206 RepID=UPI001EF6A575|nr:FusB/FusC family EF-G-binding protein [Paenibacillus sp. ACRRX]MCG7406937.1 FusB/FusC family EF-G-binding protein [Paenibacillus sp. ACRRX]
MVNPFIRNHQYNHIKKQVELLRRACNTVSDTKVVESVRYSTHDKVTALFPDSAEERDLVGSFAEQSTVEQFQHYLRSLEPSLLAFEQVTEKQLQKLFPKNKKLKAPAMQAIDFRRITYIGWMDIATNKMFLAYHLDGKLVGVEGRFTRLNKKSTCFLCRRQEEVALFSAVTRSKPANATSDYYKAIGNYLCVDSRTCNSNITDVSALEKFIHQVVDK